MLKDSIETKEYVETKDLDKMNVKDHQTTEETRKQRVLDQFRLWYANLNKPEQYYRIIE